MSSSSGWFNLKQSINVPGLKALALVFTQPSMLIPHYHINSIRDLDLDHLKASGVQCVVFDKDNTLSYCYADELHPDAVPVVNKAKLLFSNKVAILSNSVGSQDDAGFLMAQQTERTTGLPVIRHLVKKPGCLDEVVGHFQALSKEPVTAAQICVVGDRLMTDVVFANTHGMRSVLVAPLSYLRDHPTALVLRILEVRLLLPIMRWVTGQQHQQQKQREKGSKEE